MKMLKSNFPLFLIFSGSNIAAITRVIEQIVRVARTNEYTAEAKVTSVSRADLLCSDEVQSLHIINGRPDKTGCRLRGLRLRVSHAVL